AAIKPLLGLRRPDRMLAIVLCAKPSWAAMAVWLPPHNFTISQPIRPGRVSVSQGCFMKESPLQRWNK
ncbi:MAG: hypothetical protein N2C14_00610, partial [Planctomycetales bacterium]